MYSLLAKILWENIWNIFSKYMRKLLPVVLFLKLTKSFFIKCEWTLLIINSLVFPSWIIVWVSWGMMTFNSSLWYFWGPEKGSASENHLFSPESMKSRGWEGVLRKPVLLCRWCLMPVPSSVWRVDSRVPLWWPRLCAHRSVWEAPSRHQVNAFDTGALVCSGPIPEGTFAHSIA